MVKHPISLSIFFPTFNEEDNLAPLIEQTLRVVEQSPYVGEYEIIIVNDGSADNTARIAETIAARESRVRVVHHPVNMGYGAALQTGIQAARMDYVFFTDADMQFDLVELNHLLSYIGDYPVVVGYRAPRKDPPMRLLNAWGWNVLNRILFGLRIRDIDCAFKVFKRSLIQHVPIQSHGAMVSAETLIHLTRSNIPIKEVPVSHLPRTMGSPTGAKPSVILRAFKEMLMLYQGELGLPSQKEALRFMSVGVVNTLLDAVLYIVLTRFTPVFAVHLTAAKFFSFLGGTVSSLLLNRSWTFGVGGRLTMREVTRFYTTVSLSILINVSLMNFLVAHGMYDLLALVLTTGVTFAANFTLSKFWVFAKKPGRTINQKQKTYVAQ